MWSMWLNGWQEKLGKADAEQDFSEKLLPMVQVRTFIDIDVPNSTNSVVISEQTRSLPPRDDSELLYPQYLSCHGESDPFT